MQESVVLYPSPAVSHLVALVELGKLILTSRPSLTIHILITTAPYDTGDAARSYIAGVSATTPSIVFHHLPPVALPPEPSSTTAAAVLPETRIFQVLHLNKPIVAQALRSLISQNHTLHAFIIDFFCASTLSVISSDHQLKSIPSYIFFTSAAANLAGLLYLPTLDRETAPNNFKDLPNTLLDIPGVPPMPAPNMPKAVLDRCSKSYHYFLESTAFYPLSDGIIINTFEALESRAVRAMSEGLCMPGAHTPPLHCIGPLITFKEQEGFSSADQDCLKWLDSQPKQSVVFLCFGSLGLFSQEQLKEIATGLERSGHRFLWVVRNPSSVNLADFDLDSLLPQGFLDRTKERGLVVRNWAPQVEVLSHDSVGGFVSHGGWNSTLESVWAGVPMVVWPLYAEQRYNRLLLVDEMKIALPMVESDDDGFVSAGEVERRVTELLTSSETDKNSVRKRALEMKGEARAALSDGGSSRVALTKLTESWKRG